MYLMILENFPFRNFSNVTCHEIFHHEIISLIEVSPQRKALSPLLVVSMNISLKLIQLRYQNIMCH